LGSDTVESVTIRKPKFGDVRKVNSIDDDIDQQNQLIRILSGISDISDDEFDEMDYQDYKLMAEVIQDFL
jgi:hypothetical protein